MMVRDTFGPVAAFGVAVASLLAPAHAGGQVVGGVAVEAQTGAPLRGLCVRLVVLRADSTPGKPAVVDSVRTDARGLFQLVARAPGVYQLDFGPGISAGPIDSLTADTLLQRRYRVPVAARSEESPYFEFQVGRPVEPAPGNRSPRYPEELRRRNVEGLVIAEFVVGTNGRVEAGSFKVLRSSDAAFTAAVQDALPAMRFRPAELAGVVVRQRVQQPFQFRITF